MRWEGLFAELEASFDEEGRLDREAELADRTRRERALVEVSSRLAGAGDSEVALHLANAETVRGRVSDVGAGWLLLTDAVDSREVIIPVAAIARITGLGVNAREAGSRRFGLRAALREVARDRATVAVTVADGALLRGVLGYVGADHVDVTPATVDDPDRRASRSNTVLVAFGSLIAVRREAIGARG